MQVLTLKHLITVLQQAQLNGLLEKPIRAVNKVREIEAGPMEGGIMLLNKPVVGMAVTDRGLFLFTDEEAENCEDALPSLPPGFLTGNPEIDKRRGAEPGEEWKSG